MRRSLNALLLAGVSVTLPMEAKVSGTEMTLGEIARVEGLDPREVERIESIELGYSPAPGYSRLLRADRLEELVERLAPEVDVRFAGQGACRVRPETREISGETLMEVARVELLRAFAGEDASFVTAQPVQGVAIPAGVSSHAIRARVELQRPASGLFSVPVDVLVDGVPYRTVWTSWTTEVWRTLPVLGREVRAGEVIEPAMLARQRVRVEGGAEMQPLAPERLAGSVAAHDLRPGQVLTHLDVHRPVVVEVGNSLFLRVRKGGVSATVAAVALGSGAVGDRIRVRAAGSEQDLYALVAQRDLAVIDLGK